MVHVFARRGEDETIDIYWQPGAGAITAANPPMYRLAGQETKLQNVSACVAIATKEPDMSRLTKGIRKQARRTSRRNIALGSPVRDGDTSALPTTEATRNIARRSIAPGLYSPEDSVVAATVRGRRLEWINSLSGMVETSRVTKVEKIMRNGRDQVSFIDKELGCFRAVYIDAIVGVY